MSPSRTHGYKIVKLCDGMGKYKTRPVHTLILLAFAGPRPDPTMDARHLNGHKEDNFLENLAWGTKKQNAEDRERHGTRRKGERHYKAKLTDSIVIEIRSRLQSGESVRSLAREFGVDSSTIYRVKWSETWSHIT